MFRVNNLQKHRASAYVYVYYFRVFALIAVFRSIKASPTTIPSSPITQWSRPANTLEEKKNMPPHATTATPAPI